MDLENWALATMVASGPVYGTGQGWQGLQQGWQSLINQAIWTGNKIPKWVADELGIGRKELGKRIEKIKEFWDNRGDENVSIDTVTGDVCDLGSGEPLGNVHDEDD